MGTVAITTRARFARALQSRPFALLWAGQTISALGDGAYITALAWQVLILTGSAAAMSLIVIAETIPRLVFLLIGGVVADRLPRRLVMLWSDGGRAVAVLLVALLGWAHVLQLWHLIVLSLFFGFVRGFFMPAYQSIMPELVEKENLPSANALNGLTRQMSQLLGPVLGAISVSLGGANSAFAADGASFIVSALCLVFVQVSPRPQSLATAAGETGESPVSKPQQRQPIGRGNVWRDMINGLSYISGSTWLWVSLLISAVANVGFVAPLVVSLPKLVHDTYGMGVWLLGALTAANACGAIVASIFVGQLRHLRRRGLLAYSAMMLSGAAILMLGIPMLHGAQIIVSIGAATLIGCGLGIFGVIWATLLQELVPRDKLGRVSSVDLLGSYCLTPIGFAAAGVLTDHIGAGSVFVAGGVLVLLLAGIALAVPSIRHLA